MPRPPIDYSDQTIGCITIHTYIGTKNPPTKQRLAVWSVTCKCGAKHERSSEYLKRAKRNPPTHCASCTPNPKARARHKRPQWNQTPTKYHGGTPPYLPPATQSPTTNTRKHSAGNKSSPENNETIQRQHPNAPKQSTQGNTGVIVNRPRRHLRRPDKPWKGTDTSDARKPARGPVKAEE